MCEDFFLCGTRAWNMQRKIRFNLLLAISPLFFSVCLGFSMAEW